MKLKILSFALFLFTFTTIAQTQKELETGLYQLYTNTVKGNYQGLVDDSYPKIFNIIPKEKMLSALEQMMNGDGFTMMILDTPPNFKYGAIKKIGASSYCLVKHDLKMKMVFTDKLTKEEGDQMIATFKQGMQTEDVTFSQTDNAITLKKQAEVVCVADTLTNNKWMFLNRSGNALMAKIFDAKVIKELGL
jgi:hypothetical protein